MNKLLKQPQPMGRDPTSPSSLLFVCWGNVCRSPAARSVFLRYLKQEYRGTVRVDAAGVCVDEIPPAPSLAMRWVTLRRGYWLRHEPRSVYRQDLDEFEHVIAMDRRVLAALESLHRCPRGRIALLSDFLPPGFPIDVPDPMNCSAPTCHRVFDMLEQACPQLLECVNSASAATNLLLADSLNTARPGPSGYCPQ